ncbi:MAG TPA: sugar ABC transporter permease, partial [Spirochaetia bacterium]|nr:sugar ABC transporter permease [Spirochaetia bacterium]
MILKDLRSALRSNIREYGMYIALVVIMGIFTIATQGIFISSRNIANLLNQTGYIAILAIGITLVIVIRHIDLSIGFLSGFLGAVAAIAMTAWGVSTWIAILIVLVLGTLAGLLTGYLVAGVGIPAFVASLAGWLIYRGALLTVTLKTGTIIIPNEDFNAIGNGYIPDILPADTAFLPELHKLTLLLGILAIVWLNVRAFQERASRQKYGLEVLPGDMFALKQLFLSVVLSLITWVVAGYNGMSWTLAIVIVVALIYNFVTTRTVLGRHIYAVGGNPEAAELSGVSVKKITLTVFGSM